MCNYSLTGRLDFHQAKEACEQLISKATEAQAFTLRMLVLYSFNDMLRIDEAQQADNTDKEYFISNCRALLQMPKTNDTLKAELYREMGEFSKCLEVLSAASECKEYEGFVREEIRRRATQNDSKVFEIPKTNFTPDFGIIPEEPPKRRMSLVEKINKAIEDAITAIFETNTQN